MRIYYFLSNRDINVDDFIFEAKKFNSKDYMILFTKDMLNVISKDVYDFEINKKFCYAIKLESDKNIIKNISILFNDLLNKVDDLELVFDSGNKRYINKKEILYYSKNIIYISKLFNIEISSYGKYKTEYKTIGLNTLGLDEVKVYLPKEYDESVYKKFKDLICNYILENELNLFSYYEECLVIDYQEMLNYDLKKNLFLTKQNQKHLQDNLELFIECFSFKNKDDKFFVNGNIVKNLEDFKDVKEFVIKSKSMNYDHINIYYYYKNK